MSFHGLNFQCIVYYNDSPTQILEIAVVLLADKVIYYSLIVSCIKLPIFTKYCMLFVGGLLEVIFLKDLIH